MRLVAALFLTLSLALSPAAIGQQAPAPALPPITLVVFLTYCRVPAGIFVMRGADAGQLYVVSDEPFAGLWKTGYDLAKKSVHPFYLRELREGCRGV
jgi:hypothetical protein